MRFVTFLVGETLAFGATDGTSVTDLTSHFKSLRLVLETGQLDRAIRAAQNEPAGYALNDVTLLPIVPDAEKYICIGVNYVDRNAEYKDGSAAPKYPSVFLRTKWSFTGHEQPLIRPPESHKLDYEGEIAMIIGKAGRRIKEEDALDHVAGYTLMNEGTLRDWVRHAKFNVTQGKNFAKSGSLGPWMVPAQAVDDVNALTLQTRVNGELRQDDSTANLMFSFRYIIAYLSTFMPLMPGDVIATGTPNGAGARFDPPKFLKPGDSVEVSCPAIGKLINSVADESVP